MGNFGVLLGLLIGLITGLLWRWLFPHVWARYNDFGAWINVAAWTLFFGFPLGLIFGSKGRKKIVAAVWCVLFWWPMACLLLLGEHALPPFWMPGYSEAARWITATVGLMVGAWCVAWFIEHIVKGGGWEGGWDWLVSFFDRVFGRK